MKRHKSINSWKRLWRESKEKRNELLRRKGRLSKSLISDRRCQLSQLPLRWTTTKNYTYQTESGKTYTRRDLTDSKMIVMAVVQTKAMILEKNPEKMRSSQTIPKLMIK